MSIIRSTNKSLLPDELSQVVDDPKHILLDHGDCSHLFINRGKEAHYHAHLHFNGPTPSNERLIEVQNESAVWMFSHTDALRLYAFLWDSQSSIKDIVAPLLGVTVLRTAPTQVVFDVTLENWAKAYGLGDAIALLRSAGQQAKVDMLASLGR